MNNYSLESCDKYMDEELDKMGSDYFPLPIKLNQFQKATYDFIRENTKFVEGNQEISDDIKTLLVPKVYVDLSQDADEPNVWNAVQPSDYFRLVYAEPYYGSTSPYQKKFKRVTILKLGQKQSYERDPFRNSTHEYPNLIRHGNGFYFDMGTNDGTVYTKAKIGYIKNPTFATEQQLSTRIVDLPNLSIERIIDRTTNALRVIAADPTWQDNYQFDNTFGKKNQ